MRSGPLLSSFHAPVRRQQQRCIYLRLRQVSASRERGRVGASAGVDDADDDDVAPLGTADTHITPTADQGGVV